MFILYPSLYKGISERRNIDKIRLDKNHHPVYPGNRVTAISRSNVRSATPAPSVVGPMNQQTGKRFSLSNNVNSCTDHPDTSQAIGDDAMMNTPPHHGDVKPVDGAVREEHGMRKVKKDDLWPSPVRRGPLSHDVTPSQSPPADKGDNVRQGLPPPPHMSSTPVREGTQATLLPVLRGGQRPDSDGLVQAQMRGAKNDHGKGKNDVNDDNDCQYEKGGGMYLPWTRC